MNAASAPFLLLKNSTDADSINEAGLNAEQIAIVEGYIMRLLNSSKITDSKKTNQQPTNPL